LIKKIYFYVLNCKLTFNRTLKNVYKVKIKRKHLAIHIFVVIIFIFLPTICFAQSQNVTRKTQNGAFTKPLFLIESSLKCQKIYPHSDNISLEIHSDSIFIMQSGKRYYADSINISYKILPSFLREETSFRAQKKYDLSKNEYNLGSSMYDSLPTFEHRRGIKTQETDEFIETKGLTKTGSITRGVSVGSQQDVFVNSNLNLQMEGNLTDDLQIKAVISDQNVPFQPEGNTQNLQEFDKIIVSLLHKSWQVHAGNILIRNSDSYFSKYYKNVIGGLLSLNYNFSPSKDSLKNRHFVAQTHFAASIARGQFQNNSLQVFEGVQGPYRLTGTNNERFITILSGSEKIFIDGKLLQRGFNNDYIIDYNTAELTFMSSVLITRFSRVRVEFEYATQYFNRNILNFRHTQQLKKWTVSADFYREKDNKDAPLTFALDSAAKMQLSKAGDSLKAAVDSQVTVVNEFNVNRILYTYKDTLEGGVSTRIYVRALRGMSPYLQVNFTEVPQGTGDYKVGSATANGREYVWVGKNKGNYSAFRLIPAPNQKQMVAMRAKYQINKHESFFAETALSNHDANLFSSINDEDNSGFAIKTGFVSQNRAIFAKTLGKNQTKFGADYEFDNKNFRAIDRFRSIEFDRDWSVSPNSSTFQENIFNAYFSFDKTTKALDSLQKRKFFQSQHEKLGFSSQFSWRNQENNVQGTQQKYSFQKGLGFLLFQLNYFKMTSKAAERISNWERFSFNTSAFTRLSEFGYQYSVDKNAIYSTKKDSVLGSAMFFEEHKFYMQKSDSTAFFKYNLQHIKRDDYAPKRGEIKPFTHTDMWRAEASFAGSGTQKLNLNATYRSLSGLDSLKLDEKTIMGRLDWRGKVFQNALQHELIVQIGSGREQKRDFVYIPVDVGQGTHVWRDDNGDGVQQINEFYEAILPDERIYVKYWIPTSDFINAYTKEFNFRTNLILPSDWGKAGVVKKVFHKFSHTLSLLSNQKNTSSEWYDRFLPFNAGINPNLIISERETWRSTLFFNRQNAVWGGDWTYNKSNQKNLLSNGYEGRNLIENRYSLRWTIKRIYTLKMVFAHITRSNSSDFMLNRNYFFTQNTYNPEMAWQPNPRYRFSIFADFSQKTTQENEKASLNAIGFELRSLAGNNERMINAKAKMTQIDYVGQANTPLAYELLEALQVGRNFTLEINLQQKIFNGLRLNFTYNGRKSNDNAFVHIGRVQLTALF